MSGGVLGLDGFREGGPYFDDLRVGLSPSAAPAATLTAGLAAVHQAIVADRLRLALDAELSARVLGGGAPFVHPALVWDLAIGQSTPLTRRVRANLFYRGLAFHRAPVLGDTLRSHTEVVALRENRRREDRPPTGLAALRIRTVDQHDRPVLDFTRCAMLPLSPGAPPTGHDDDLDGVGETTGGATAAARLIDGWDLDPFVAGGRGEPPVAGTTLRPGSGDVVSSAPELARLTLNVAGTHHDAALSGERLVYGGHTIGIAAAQAARTLPGLVTIAAWHSCDHTGPVREGDTLHSETGVERVETLARGHLVADLRTRVRAVPAAEGDPSEVLDWRWVGVFA